MTQSLYVIGGAGTGKSTFMAEILSGRTLGPHEVLYDLGKNSNGTATRLKGHRINGGEGVYIGNFRPGPFPGTDGLARHSSPAGIAWVEAGDLPAWIVAEGATFATRNFLGSLYQHTDLLVVHLYADEWLRDIRFLGRGSKQKPSFVASSATKSANLMEDLDLLGVKILNVDSGQPEDWKSSIESSRIHLQATT